MSLIIQIIFICFLLVSNTYSQTSFRYTYGTVGSDKANSLVMTYDRGFVLAGSTGIGSNGNSDGYLIKVDSAGKVKWTSKYGGDQIESINSIIQTKDSSLVMTGITSSLGRGYDVYLIKTDSLGNLLWSKTFGGFDWDFGHSVTETKDGGFLIGGETFSFGKGNNDMYIIKTNIDGDTLWTKTYGGFKDESCLKVIETSSGELVLCGYTSSFGSGKKDAYIIKTNSVGDTLWTKTSGGASDDVANDILEAFDLDYVVVGYSSSFGNGGKDYSIHKFKQNGDIDWEMEYSWMTGEEEFLSVEQFSDGSYVLAGTTTSFGGGREDYHIQITYPNSVWVQATKGPTFGGSEKEILSDLVLTGAGGFAVLGTTDGFDVGNTDFYLVKSDTTLFPDNTPTKIGFVEPVAVNELHNEENEIFIYPNPFLNHLFIENKINDLTLEIRNLFGIKFISTPIYPFRRNNIDCSGLNRGIYTYSVVGHNDHIYKVGKLIKYEE